MVIDADDRKIAWFGGAVEDTEGCESLSHGSIELSLRFTNLTATVWRDKRFPSRFSVPPSSIIFGRRTKQLENMLKRRRTMLCFGQREGTSVNVIIY